jgi:predicted HTH transcriptional regulator
VFDKALINYLISHGREERNLEYKQSMSWTDIATKVKVAKSAMAMANISDGGYIVFGEKKNGEVYEPEGMQKDHVDSFKQDDVMEWVNKYADPYVELLVSPIERDGKLFVIIQVQEFAQLPVVCKKEGEGLKRGDVFTRSRRKYETARVGTQTEMREILDLAVDKEIRRLRSRDLITSVEVVSPTEADKKSFEAQREGL